MKNVNCSNQVILGIFDIFEQVIRYNLDWDSLRFINRGTVYEQRKVFQTRLYKHSLFKNFKHSL
jgi:hypothetical protein